MADNNDKSPLASWAQADDKRTEVEDWMHGQGGIVMAVFLILMVLGLIYYVLTTLL